MTYIQRRGPLLPGELSKGSTLAGLGGITDIVSSVSNAIGSIVSGSTAAFLSLAAPHYKMVSGVAKATDSATLELFKAVQTQANRIAKIKGLKVYAIDGAIGGDTATLINSVSSAAAADYNAWTKLQTADQIKFLADLIALPSTPEGIATNALGYYSLLKQYADRLAAPPAVASPPPAAPPSYVDVNGANVSQSSAASAMDAWKRLGTGTQLAAVGALAVVGVFALKGSKKRRK